MKHHITGFMDFVRTQGVVGLAVGIILGGAVTKLVASLVGDLINPVIGIFLGNFISSLIDFGIIAAVVYLGVKKLKLDKLDKPKV